MGALLDVGLSNAVAAGLLAVVAGTATLVCRRPAVRHSLWLLVLVKLVTPSLVPVPMPSFGGDVAAALATEPDPQPVELTLLALPAEAAAEEEEDEPTDALLAAPTPVPDAPAAHAAPAAGVPFPWKPVAAAVWLTGSLAWLAWTAVHVLRFRRLLRFARPAPVGLRRQVGELASKLGLARTPRIDLVAGAVAPMVWALDGQPRLLFPTRLLDRLDDEQRKALLLHELAHVCRRDHWVRWLELGVTALFWWHPVVWWAKREIHEAEEQCCDAWVVWALGGAGRSYALALVQAVEFFSQARSPLPVAASGIGPVPHLRRRLTMIMQGQTPRSLSWAGGCAVLAVGLLLPLAPVHAQGQREPARGDAERQHREAVEALRKALQTLEGQLDDKDGKREVRVRVLQDAVRELDKARADAPKPKASSAEIDKARAALDAARKDLEKAEAKFREATAQLARLEGRPVPMEQRRYEIRLHSEDGKPGEPYRATVVAPEGKPGESRRAIVVAPEGQHAPRVIQVQPGAAPKDPVIRVQPGTPSPDARGGGDVEKKLERLMKEIEEIRREIRREPARPVPPAAPRAPAAPGRPAANPSGEGIFIERVPPTDRVYAVPAVPPTPALPRVPPPPREAPPEPQP